MYVDALVWDSASLEPVPDATVSVVDASGNLKSAVAADDAGEFIIDSPYLDQGYNLQITSAGYQGVVVAPSLLVKQGGIGLDRSGALEPAYVVKKKLSPWWLIGGAGLVLLLLSEQKKSGRVGAMSEADWMSLALKIGIAVAAFYFIVVPILSKLGLYGKSDQAKANEQSVDNTLSQVKAGGGQAAASTLNDATLTGMANQIYDLGGADPVDQQAIRNVVIQVNTLTDMLGLVKAFGTRKVGGSFLSLCGFFGVNCPEMDLPTFLRATIPDQLNTVNSYLSSTGINYQI
jgi:hypothetical protein